MIIPVYDSYEEFKNNYQNDLAEFLQKFPVCNEGDYKSELIEFYEKSIQIFSQPITPPKLKGSLFKLTHKIENNIEWKGRDITTFEEQKNILFNFKKICADLTLQQEITDENQPNNNKPAKPRTTDLNFKFALLDEMGVIKYIKTNVVTNNKDRAEILQEIIGGSISTLDDYISGKTKVNKDVRQKAIDLLEKYRYPK